MVDEQANTGLMEVGVLAKRQRAAHQIGAALAQGVVETLDVGSLTAFFPDSSMAFGRLPT